MITKLVAIIITVVLVAILFSQISIDDVAKTILSVEPVNLVIGFILCLCLYFFRALRFHILLGKKVSIKDLFKIVCMHNMANNILPARTGEISYVYLSNKLHDIPTGNGLASLMIARIFDFIAVSVLFFISAMGIRDLPDMIGQAIWIIAIFLILVVLVLIALVYFGEAFIGAMKNVIARLGLGRFRVVEYLLRKGDETVGSFRIVKDIWVAAQTGIASMAIWISLYLIDYVLLNAMGINLSIYEVILGSTFSVFTIILPIQGIGGFGTFEGGWTIGFMAMGVPKAVAIASGFGVHILTIIYTLILGSYGALTTK